jgi:hypothetical protein
MVRASSASIISFALLVNLGGGEQCVPVQDARQELYRATGESWAFPGPDSWRDQRLPGESRSAVSGDVTRCVSFGLTICRDGQAAAAGRHRIAGNPVLRGRCLCARSWRR